MKARLDAIIRREQAEYLERLLPANTGIIAEMEADAEKNRVPIADRAVISRKSASTWYRTAPRFRNPLPDVSR